MTAPPREPTDKMLFAGTCAWTFKSCNARAVWQAMYDAAPAPSAEPPELTFGAFRAANVARCLKWHPQGIDSWSPSDWLTAVTGELGELASLLKMRNRERDGLPGNKFSPSDKQVADEIADVLTYLDLLAEVLGVDLGAAAVSKFNEVSERVGFPDRIVLNAAPAPSADECTTCGSADPAACLRRPCLHQSRSPAAQPAEPPATDDLVQRLRLMRVFNAMAGARAFTLSNEHNPVAQEAADLIERQAREIAEWRTAAKNGDEHTAAVYAKLDRAEAERDTLRECVRVMIEWMDHPVPTPDELWIKMKDALDAARAKVQP